MNTKGIRTTFDMGLAYLCAATFLNDEHSFDRGDRSSIEMLLIKPQEKLLINVSIYSRKTGSFPEIDETRVVNFANRKGDEEYEENTEYETTNVYMASGGLTP